MDFLKRKSTWNGFFLLVGAVLGTAFFLSIPKQNTAFAWTELIFLQALLGYFVAPDKDDKKNMCMLTAGSIAGVAIAGAYSLLAYPLWTVFMALCCCLSLMFGVFVKQSFASHPVKTGQKIENI
jgi:hypothetical protein